MRDEDLARTRMILELWGDWSSNNTGCGWYNEMPGIKNVLPRPFNYKEKLSDEAALKVDSWVAKMYDHKDPRRMTYFILHYVYGLSNYEIARREKIAERKSCSEGKVRGAISIIENRLVGRVLSHEEEKGAIEILS